MFDFLPAVGDPSYLDNDLLNPASTSAGTLAGHVLALQLNVSFADAGLLGGGSVLRFPDLRLCGVSSAPLLNNLTVRETLAAANRVLGGVTTPDDYEQFATAVAQLTNSFESGMPSPFAQQHLRNGSCPVVWQPGDLVTYNQQNWGSINTAASALLINHFESLSPNGVEIGVVGNAGNSALFTTVDAVLEALPTSGTAGPFINDLVDPDFSQGGTLAGYALALHFNVTYSDAHLLGANSTLRLGDLRVCGVSDMPQFNNLTVRQVLAFANQVLGFVITLNDNDYEPIALFVERLTESFESGTVSVFAQRHLVNGICASGWSSGAVITYGQESWGTSRPPPRRLCSETSSTASISVVLLKSACRVPAIQRCSPRPMQSSHTSPRMALQRRSVTISRTRHRHRRVSWRLRSRAAARRRVSPMPDISQGHRQCESGTSLSAV